MRGAVVIPEPQAHAALGFKAPANVRARHQRIIALRREGWSMPMIALKLGLSAHSTVRYHVTGECDCERRVR